MEQTLGTQYTKLGDVMKELKRNSHPDFEGQSKNRGDN